MTRLFWLCCFSLLLSVSTAGSAHAAFEFEDVIRMAAERSKRPYQRPDAAAPGLAELTYDQYRGIRFKESQALWRDTDSPFRVQFFHSGRGFRHALRLHEVVAGEARLLEVPREAFDSDSATLPPTASVAGLRVVYPLHTPGRWDEVLALLGASYFRAIGAEQRYGASARALAIDTVGGAGEEFPDHVELWLERPAAQAPRLVIHALVDGPRVSGAYRYTLQPGKTTTIDVDARLFLRGAPAVLGIAPMSSMYLAGENQPATGDFRPEVHDSDGLQVAVGTGEWLWRPLVNPAGTFVTSFQVTSLRGFGLMQRDRAFHSYEDLEARYERRPSVWVEPLTDWGPGRVELLQFRTPDETHDNVASYWVPDRLPPAGSPWSGSWRLHWAADDAPRPPGSMALQTRRGHGWREKVAGPNDIQLQVDFDGPADDGPISASEAAVAVSPDAGPRIVEAVASSNANVRALKVRAEPNTARGGWRMTIDFERIDAKQAVELRAFLRRGDQTLSETWTYAIAPES